MRERDRGREGRRGKQDLGRKGIEGSERERY